MHDTLRRLFDYKAWANDALLSNLSQLAADSQISGLAIKALSHSYIVDRIFAAHLRGEQHSYTSANASELPTLERLSNDIRRSDQEYVSYVSKIGGFELADRIDFAFTDGAAGRMSREEMLMHVITHGVGHRGQISAVMLLHSASPSRDGFTTYLHEREASSRRRSA